MISHVRSQGEMVILLGLFGGLVIGEYLQLIPGAALCYLLLTTTLSLRPRVILGMSVVRDVVLLLPLGVTPFFVLVLRLIESRLHGTIKRMVSIGCGSAMILCANWLSVRHVNGRMLLMPIVYLMCSIAVWGMQAQRRSIESLYESTS